MDERMMDDPSVRAGSKGARIYESRMNQSQRNSEHHLNDFQVAFSKPRKLKNLEFQIQIESNLRKNMKEWTRERINERVPYILAFASVTCRQYDEAIHMKNKTLQ